MSVTLQAAVPLGKDYTENLRSTKNQPKKSLRQLFQVSERLITDQTEITGPTTIDWQQPMWDYSVNDKLFSLQLPEPVFSDSVHVWEVSVLNQSKPWEREIRWFLGTRYLQDLDRIDGEQMEFVWKFSQDSLHWVFSTRFERR